MFFAIFDYGDASDMRPSVHVTRPRQMQQNTARRRRRHFFKLTFTKPTAKNAVGLWQPTLTDADGLENTARLMMQGGYKQVELTKIRNIFS
jgi:hypothetical protein